MITANEWLRGLTQFYTPSADEFDEARAHRAAIEVRLRTYLGLNEMFEIGSLRHGTGVSLYSDADYLAVLTAARPLTSNTILDKVKVQLQLRFPTSTVRVRRPAVVCDFTNGSIEIVPAYRADSGYWIADPAGDWMLTHPKDHNEYVTTINKRHNGAVKLLVRQVKIWKYRRNVPISSCYLEMRTAKHMAGTDLYVPLWDLYLTLKGMRDVSLAAMNDPTGLGSRFGACSTETRRSDALSKLETAVMRAQKAKDYAREGDELASIEQLKLLFDW